MRRPTRNNADRRGKNLTDDAIEQIVRLLDAWNGKLTWEGLIEALVPRLHCRYTRQALFKHERIRAAYALRKESLSSGKMAVRRGSWQAEEVVAQIARLEAENQRLEAENGRLLEQFVVWAYNAHTRGLSKEFLSAPLPRVNRDQTLTAVKQARTSTKSR